MSFIGNIKSGIRQGFRFRRVALYIFLIQTFLSLTVGVLSINYVNSSIGSSTSLMKIIDGYDHDVFQDLLRFESTGWSMIKTFIWITILIYLLLGPFIMAGILSCFQSAKDEWNSFWTGGSKYYFTFLKLNLLVLLSVLVVGGILATVTFFFANYSLENMLTEIPALVSIFAALFLLIIYTIHLVSISTKAKWNMITHNETGVISNFRKASGQVRKKFGSYVLLGLFFLAVSIAFAFLSNTLINCVPESGFLLVLFAFVLQMLVLFFKIFLRNSYYAAIVGKEDSRV